MRFQIMDQLKLTRTQQPYLDFTVLDARLIDLVLLDAVALANSVCVQREVHI